MLRRTLALSVAVPLLLGLPAQAQAPAEVSHQGYLEENGQPVDGTHTLRFGLYAAPQGGNALWSEVHPGVAITDGVYSVVLGAQTPFPSDEFAAPRWLEVAVGATILAPRTRLTASPYAMGLVAPLEVRTGASGAALEVETTGSPASAVRGVASATTGSVYGVVGASNSAGGAGVQGAGAVGVSGFTLSNSGRAVYGEALASGGTTYGVFGEAASSSGRGVHGLTTASSGTTYGVSGEAASSSGRGVYGRATASSGNTYGVFGESESVGGRGVYGIASAATGLGYGVYGRVASSSGRAVYGQATATSGAAYGGYFTTGSPDGFGLYAANTAGGLAARLNGDVRVDNEMDFYQSGERRINVDPGENASAPAIKLYRGGNVVLELDASHDGNARVITEELEITGGADLAEHFDVGAAPGAAAPGPGMVVSIDPAQAGRLAVSARPYDPLVAGVVSGAGGVAPGLMMGQRGSIADGAHPVALVGRVYVLADAAYGPIRPGDLLTTSATPGHAMRAADRERAAGAVLGKAMTGLEAERGLVLVLVSLQ